MRLSIFVLLLVTFSVSRCTCNYHMKRIQKKCPLKSDTVVVMDTITINSSSVDTIFKFSPLVQRDTLVIRENGVVVKYFYNTKDSTVFIKGEKEIQKVPYEKTVIRNVYNTKLPWWVMPLKWSVFTLVLIMALLYFYEKYRGRIKSKIRLNE